MQYSIQLIDCEDIARKTFSWTFETDELSHPEEVVGALIGCI
jgi:hypothetical protein